MQQIFWSHLTIIKQYPYLTQALPFPLCQKHVLTKWIINLHLHRHKNTKSMVLIATVSVPLAQPPVL